MAQKTTAADIFDMKNFPVLVFALAALALFSCKKEEQNPEYPFTITVKTFGDTIPAQNIFVEVYAPISESDVAFEGITNEAGQVSFTYDKNAIFLVRATRGNKPNFSHIGCTLVRLEPNQEVLKTVYLEPFDPEFEGCTFTP